MKVAAVLLLFWAILPPVARCADGDDLLPGLKVAYIYNFTRFIEWPEPGEARPFVIGVIGDAVMERLLRVLEQEAKRVDESPIVIRAYGSLDTIWSCDVLFVGAAAEDQLEAVVRRTAGKPILLIGDTPGYAARGVAIELFRKPDIFRKTDRLRFRINRAALRKSGLVVSAQLYDVAEVIE